MKHLFKTKSVCWRSLVKAEEGLEIAWFEGSVMSGTILRTVGKRPLEIRYRFSLTKDFRVTQATIETKSSKTNQFLNFESQKNFWLINGKQMSQFDDCTDLDLWPTPLTNTMTIRRLALRVGESKDLQVLGLMAPV